MVDVKQCEADMDTLKTSAQSENSEVLCNVPSGSGCSVRECTDAQTSEIPLSPTDTCTPSPKLRKSLASLVETPSPGSRKSRTFPDGPSDADSKQPLATDTSSPESANTLVRLVDSLPSSPAQLLKGKSSKRKSSAGSPKRKRSSERKRGLSTSSSDDPKSSRSRTESGGSDVLEALDLSPMKPQGSYSMAAGVYMDEMQGSETLDVQSPDLNVSERTLIAEQDNVEEKSKADSSRVLFDLQSLTSPTDTSSPIISKEKKAKKKKKKSEKDSKDGKKSKRSGKRKRGLSTSSSEDPKSSRSRTESMGSETACSIQPVDSAATVEDLDGFCFSNEIPCEDKDVVVNSAPPVAGSAGLKCRVCITDCDDATNEYDYSEC